MAESVEREVAVEEKKISEVEEMDLKNAEENISAASEVTAETEAISVPGDKTAVDEVPEKPDEVAPMATDEEESLPEKSSVPATLNDEVPSDSPNDQVTTEELVPEESKKVAEESSPSSSKKRKPEDDEEMSGEDIKKQKTEETPAGEEAIQSNETDAPVEESAPAETEVIDTVTNNTEANPAENSIPEIPAESEPKPNEEENITGAPVEKEEAEVVNNKEEEKDLSENKENVIDETISNGTTEKEATKTVESVEEEAVKVPAAKTLDETEQPKEAEAVSS